MNGAYIIVTATHPAIEGTTLVIYANRYDAGVNSIYRAKEAVYDFFSKLDIEVQRDQFNDFGYCLKGTDTRVATIEILDDYAVSFKLERLEEAIHASQNETA